MSQKTEIMIKNGSDELYTIFYPNPNIPVTITFGDNDIFGESMNFIKNRYPNAKIYIIKNSGHFPALHNPKDYFDILNQHFKV